MMFTADVEKAFYSVEHDFSFATLKKFDFGSQFIQWIRITLNGAQSCVMNNSFSTGYFNVKEVPGKEIPCLPVCSY